MLAKSLSKLIPVWAVWSLALVAGAVPARGLAPELVSVGTNGVAPSGASSGVASNGDGTVVGYYSDAALLVPGDTNQVRDVFVRHLDSGVTERVSVSSSGQQANRPSHAAGGAPSLSADGTLVAFYSDATNLVDVPTSGIRDVYVRNLVTGVTELVSVAVNGSPANGASLFPSISADGRFVAFQSQASNLVAGDTNGVADIFVRDLVDGTTIRACDGVQSNNFSFTPALSGDGSVVAFASGATNLVAADTNKYVDIFVCDLAAGTVTRVSVGPGGTEGNGDSILPAISADGSVIAFKSLASNLVPNDRNGVVDVFAHDRETGATERVSLNRLGGDPDDFSFPPSVSGDGRFVAFGSMATNIVAFDANQTSDVFVRDRNIGISLLVGVNAQGQQPDRGTPDIPPAISGDGRRVGFVSFATNLSPVDGNQVADVYIDFNPFFGPGGCPNGDEDCSDGQVCVDGFCIDPVATPTPTRTPTVTNTPTLTSTPTPTPTFRPCLIDDDCPDGKICRGGFCRDPRACDPEDPALELLMCFDRETCVNNLCECGGDCNLDGYVLGTEITRAILILAGSRDLSECVAADIDLDGAVMGNEITLAIINLDEGCLQEGRPLLFAHDRGETVAVHLESAMAPSGRTAEVTVGISGGSGEVATVQLDVLYDPKVLRIAEPGHACRKDPRLADQVLIAAAPNQPPAPEGLERLRLFVGSTAAPINTVGDGAVISCAFEVLPVFPGGAVTLRPDRLNVGDARGNTFRVVATDGTVEIPVVEVTPVPTPSVRCAGDCDGDGEVQGNEITRVVRVMIADAPLASCPAADADGDGDVFVTDVTRAVINMGLGCPE